jgi:hypothetical protein
LSKSPIAHESSMLPKSLGKSLVGESLQLAIRLSYAEIRLDLATPATFALKTLSPSTSHASMTKKALEKLMYEINALSSANVRVQGFSLVVGTRGVARHPYPPNRQPQLLGD